MIGWKSREITFQQYRENLAKEFKSFPMGYKYMNIKDITMPDNSLLFNYIQNTYTNLSPR